MSRPDTVTDNDRRDFAAERLHDYITTIVNAAPPLTTEQRDRLALALRPTSHDGRAAK